VIVGGEVTSKILRPPSAYTAKLANVVSLQVHPYAFCRGSVATSPKLGLDIS
jgi:hypothetical protein